MHLVELLLFYSGANGKWYRNSWKEFNELKNIDEEFYCSNYYDVELNNYKVKTGASLRSGKIKVIVSLVF